MPFYRALSTNASKYFPPFAVLMAFALVVAGCDQDLSSDTTSTMTIQEALDKHTRDLVALDGVQGTAQGRCDEQPCITVYVLEKTPELRQAVPDTLEGYPVSLVKTERFEAQPPQQSDSSSESRGEGS